MSYAEDFDNEVFRDEAGLDPTFFVVGSIGKRSFMESDDVPSSLGRTGSVADNSSSLGRIGLEGVAGSVSFAEALLSAMRAKGLLDLYFGSTTGPDTASSRSASSSAAQDRHSPLVIGGLLGEGWASRDHLLTW